MNLKNDIINWLNERQQNFVAWRINNEPYQLNLDTAVAVWIGSGYSNTAYNALVDSINAFCNWHNIPKPKGFAPS